MTKRWVQFAAILLVGLSVSAGAALAVRSGNATNEDRFKEVVAFDTGEERSQAPLPQAESNSYNHFDPVVEWPARDEAVEYLIEDQPGKDAKQATLSAVASVDRLVTSVEFRHVKKTKQKNPCTGKQNSIKWYEGDGPGGLLAMAAVCYDTRTNRMVGFRVVVDSLEQWSTTGEAGKFDVESVLAHEMGHIGGLDHVKGQVNALLTMYPSTSPGETHKRTLALGDRTGLDLLYSSDEEVEHKRKGRGKGKGRDKGDYAEIGGPNLFWD